MALWRKVTGTVLVDGKPEPNVKVYFYEKGTTNPIPVYSDEGSTSADNPQLTDASGRYAVYLDVETYPVIRIYLEKDGVDFTEANADLDGVPVPGAVGTVSLGFTDLTDTPSSYSGSGGKVVKVKSTEDGLEFGQVDHGELAGLSDDDHPQYLLADGSRPLSGDLDFQGHLAKVIGKLNFKDATTLTISSGAVTVSQSYHYVDTEGGASTDDLDTINGGTAGDILYLRTADSSRTVVIRHGTGNIVTPDGNDYSLDSTYKVVALLFDGTNWHLVGAAGGGGGGASTFLDLTDTPSSYTGSGGKVVKVKSTEDGLEFGNAAEGTFEDITIYVDSTNGSDTAGDGTQANPFKTINRALEAVPKIIQHTVTIHLVASGTPYDAFDLRHFVAAGGKLILEGEGTVLASGTVSSLEQEVDDPVYGSSVPVDKIVDNNASWSTNQYQWKLLRLYKDGCDDIYRLITYNDATGLYVMADFNETYDGAMPDNTWSYQILDWGCQINGACSARDILCPVTIKKIYFSDEIDASSLLIIGPSFTSFELLACKFDRSTNAGYSFRARGGLGLDLKHSLFKGTDSWGVHIIGSINTVYVHACYFNCGEKGLWIEIHGEGRGRILASRFKGNRKGIDAANATFVMHPLTYDAKNVFDGNTTGIYANRYGYFIYTNQCYFTGNTTNIDTSSDYSGYSSGA